MSVKTLAERYGIHRLQRCSTCAATATRKATARVGPRREGGGGAARPCGCLDASDRSSDGHWTWRRCVQLWSRLASSRTRSSTTACREAGWWSGSARGRIKVECQWSTVGLVDGTSGSTAGDRRVKHGPVSLHSFHCDRDAWRVQQIIQMGALEDIVCAATRSSGEESSAKGDAAIKVDRRSDGLQVGSHVVLIGAQTASRQTGCATRDRTPGTTTNPLVGIPNPMGPSRPQRNTDSYGKTHVQQGVAQGGGTVSVTLPVCSPSGSRQRSRHYADIEGRTSLVGSSNACKRSRPREIVRRLFPMPRVYRDQRYRRVLPPQPATHGHTHRSSLASTFPDIWTLDRSTARNSSLTQQPGSPQRSVQSIRTGSMSSVQLVAVQRPDCLPPFRHSIWPYLGHSVGWSVSICLTRQAPSRDRRHPPFHPGSPFHSLPRHQACTAIPTT